MTHDELRTALERIKELGGPVEHVSVDSPQVFGVRIKLRGLSHFVVFDDSQSQHPQPTRASHEWLIIGALMEDLNRRKVESGLSTDSDGEWEAEAWLTVLEDGEEVGFVPDERSDDPLEAVIKTYIQALEATQSEP